MRTIPRSLRVLIDDPIVRLMMAADRVAEGELLVVLSRACDRVCDAGSAQEEPNGHPAGRRPDVPAPEAFRRSTLDGTRTELRSAS